MRPEDPPIRKAGSDIRTHLREIDSTLTNVMSDDDIAEIKTHMQEIASYDLSSWALFKSATDQTRERLRNNPTDQEKISDAISYGELDHYTILDTIIRLEYTRPPKAQYGDVRYDDLFSDDDEESQSDTPS